MKIMMVLLKILKQRDLWWCCYTSNSCHFSILLGFHIFSSLFTSVHHGLQSSLLSYCYYTITTTTTTPLWFADTTDLHSVCYHWSCTILSATTPTAITVDLLISLAFSLRENSTQNNIAWQDTIKQRWYQYSLPFTCWRLPDLPSFPTVLSNTSTYRQRQQTVDTSYLSTCILSIQSLNYYPTQSLSTYFHWSHPSIQPPFHFNLPRYIHTDCCTHVWILLLLLMYTYIWMTSTSSPSLCWSIVYTSPIPFALSSSLTRKKYPSSGNPKYAGPPLVFVLWCTPFHVTTVSHPVVKDRPTVKVIRRWKHTWRRPRTSLPSLLSGK